MTRIKFLNSNDFRTGAISGKVMTELPDIAIVPAQGGGGAV